MIALYQRLVPRPLRYRLRHFFRDLGVLPRAASLALGPRVARDRARVFYGFLPGGGAGRIVLGGEVKLQQLSSAFPDHPRDFNLVYLVSSAPSPGSRQVAWAARRRGARLVWNQNGVAYPAWYGPGHDAVNGRMARLLHAADHVFYQSEFCRRAADRYLGPRSGPSEVLYNAIDTSLFSPSRDAKPPGPVLLVAGTHNRRYRVAAAVEVLARLRRAASGVRLVVAGPLRWTTSEDEARREILALAAERGVEEAVELTGTFGRAEAPDVFRRGDVLIHTQYNDCCPGIVVEAMACGLPVVYSRSGGVFELVGEEAGVGVATDESWEKESSPDPEALAAATETVLARRQEFASAARQRAVDRFDVKPWVRRHAEVFEALLA